MAHWKLIQFHFVNKLTPGSDDRCIIVAIIGLTITHKSIENLFYRIDIDRWIEW